MYHTVPLLPQLRMLLGSLGIPVESATGAFSIELLGARRRPVPSAMRTSESLTRSSGSSGLWLSGLRGWGDSGVSVFGLVLVLVWRWSTLVLVHCLVM